MFSQSTYVFPEREAFITKAKSFFVENSTLFPDYLNVLA